MRNSVRHAAGRSEPFVFQCRVLGKLLLAYIGQYKNVAILTAINRDDSSRA